MKKFGILLAVAAFLLSALPVLASPGSLHLGSKGQLDPKACAAEGKVVINVEEKVLNDADSGFQGNYWAFDSYTRHIKVWQTGPDTWCATVKYEGKFEAVEGQKAPGVSGTIGADVDGNLNGGYRATFTGTLLADPSWPTHGNVGTIDYECDLNANCPGRVDWVAQYFGPGYTNFDQPWWGWIYKSNGHHGTWLNEIDVLPADSGNIQ